MYKKKSDLEHSSTEENIRLAVSGWFEAVEEFLQWQDKLHKAISAYYSTEYDSMNGVFSTNVKWSQADLIRLHVSLADDLRNLLKEINFIDDGLSSLAKVHELNRHTETICHWSKKIQNALMLSSSGTA